MGLSNEVKSEKSSSPAPSPQEQQSIVHVYSDWAAMQACYGPQVALPPYFCPAVPSGHPPSPYMWLSTQAMMPPYGGAYAAIYQRGGVYAHPAVSMGSQPPGPGVPCSASVSNAVAGTLLSMDIAGKKSGDNNQGFVKKLKRLDDLAISLGNGNSEKTEGAAENRLSQSSEGEGSSGGSYENTVGTDDKKRNRSCERTPTAASNEKAGKNDTPQSTGQLSSAPDKVLGFPIASVNRASKCDGSAATPNMDTALELRNPGANPATSIPSSNAAISPETWMQTERKLKREKRKQSNRESARRSRLKKQAEAKELARRVNSLNADNMALKYGINQLKENSEKLRHENAKLMEKLKNSEARQVEDIAPMNPDSVKRSAKIVLSRVNNAGSSGSSGQDGSDACENGGNSSGAKLHQLLNANLRADAVAAG